jgi:DNA-directed RNA polymerase specialized sigma24 family protein
MPADRLSSTAGGNAHFETTQWGLVAAASAGDENGKIALESLYRSYCAPVYSFLRRRGFNRQDAQDLTQDFFLHLLEKETLSRADPQKGKFRTFLLGALNFFIAHFHERAQAQKRGGGSRLIYLDDQTAEEAYQLADPGQTPEQIFEARWAATLMERTILGLQSEMEAAGKGKLFDELKGFLIDGERHFLSTSGSSSRSFTRRPENDHPSIARPLSRSAATRSGTDRQFSDRGG